MILELPQFGKLAYDLHLPQDNVTLSAVEDIFYLLSDRKPCQILAAQAASSAAAHSSSTNKASGGNRRSTSPSKGGAAEPRRTRGSVAGASGSAPAGTSRSSSKAGAEGDSEGRPLRVAALPREMIVPEQFPEGLVRLACIRYRCGCW
jgi:hypothetical protein